MNVKFVFQNKRIFPKTSGKKNAITGAVKLNESIKPKISLETLHYLSQQVLRWAAVHQDLQVQPPAGLTEVPHQFAPGQDGSAGDL